LDGSEKHSMTVQVSHFVVRVSSRDDPSGVHVPSDTHADSL